MTYLLSDLAAGITSQVLQVRGTDVVLVRHPTLSEHFATNEHWTAESVAAEFGPTCARTSSPWAGSPPWHGLGLPG